MSRARRILIRLAAIAALAWAAAGTVIALSGGDRAAERCREFRFDANAWKPETRTVTPKGRGEIADRLVECGTLTGRSQRRVRRMLGRPRRVARRLWTYPVRADGFIRGAKVLRVEFDARRRVTRTTIDGADG